MFQSLVDLISVTKGENAMRVEEIKQVPPPLYTFWATKFLTNVTNFRDATWSLLPYQTHKYHD